MRDWLLLPEYVSEHLSWEQLEKIKLEELNKLNLFIHRGLSVAKIDSTTKTIEDAAGQLHAFDLLIMATGSRPFIPREVPLHLAGVFTMRNRTDADRLKTYLKETGLPSKIVRKTLMR